MSVGFIKGGKYVQTAGNASGGGSGGGSSVSVTNYYNKTVKRYSPVQPDREFDDLTIAPGETKGFIVTDAEYDTEKEKPDVLVPMRFFANGASANNQSLFITNYTSEKYSDGVRRPYFEAKNICDETLTANMISFSVIHFE